MAFDFAPYRRASMFGIGVCQHQVWQFTTPHHRCERAGGESSPREAKRKLPEHRWIRVQHGCWTSCNVYQCVSTCVSMCHVVQKSAREIKHTVKSLALRSNQHPFDLQKVSSCSLHFLQAFRLVPGPCIH